MSATDGSATRLRRLLAGLDWHISIPILAFLGLLGTSLYVLQFPASMAWSVLGTAFVTSGAAAFTGALVGLLFGIPFAAGTSSAPATGKGSGRYKGNTNLEQISDWLTKLLVGAGLVQLGRTPAAFSRLANALSNGFGGTNSSAPFGLTFVIFYAGCGFFYLYLWSRLSLPKRLDAAEEFPATVESLEKAPPVKITSVESSPAPQTGGDVIAPIPTDEVLSAFAVSSADAASRSLDSLAYSIASPRDSLSEIGLQIRREIKRLLAATGHADAVGYPTDQLITALEGIANVPMGALDTIRRFYEVQDQYKLTGGEVDESVLRRAVESGIGIIDSLRSVPREHHFVYATQIPLYEDHDGTQLVQEAKGLILRSTTTESGNPVFRILPTTRTGLEIGQEVSWEWNDAREFGPTWYRDPDDGSIKKAWDASLEFVGRSLSDFN